jgi:hypothetical protein
MFPLLPQLRGYPRRRSKGDPRRCREKGCHSHRVSEENTSACSRSEGRPRLSNHCIKDTVTQQTLLLYGKILLLDAQIQCALDPG